PVYLPARLILEHTVLPGLTEKERKGADRIREIISQREYSREGELSSIMTDLKQRWNLNDSEIDSSLIKSEKLLYLSSDDFTSRCLKCTYASEKEYFIVFKTDKNALLLKPLDIKDHLATHYVEIKKDARGKNLLKLTLCYSEADYSNGKCLISVQNEKFEKIFFTICYVSNQTQPHDRCEVKYFSYPENTSKIRVLIHSKDGTPTYIPEAIILEHLTIPLDKLSEAEKEETDRILKTISQKEILPSLRNEENIFARYSLTEYEKIVASFSSKEVLQDFFKTDPWFANYIINIWEYVHGETVLSTYPWRVCIPIADTCNAACPFCNSWILGTRQLNLDESANFLPLLRNAKLLGLAGHGEPLIHTEFEKIARQFHEILDPRCVLYLITNGILLDRYLDLLVDINVQTFNISLNAAAPQTYSKVMGVSEKIFDRIITCIERLVSLRENSEKKEIPIVNISMVVINQNIHELASFIELGNRLKVDTIHLNTLMPQSYLSAGLNYHTLPPYLNPGFLRYKEEALRAIAKSKAKVLTSPNTWDTPIYPSHLEEEIRKNPPPRISVQEARKNRAKYQDKALKLTKGCPLPVHSLPATNEETEETNPYGRTPRHRCTSVYYNLNLNDFLFRLNPCCYIWDIPGFEPMIYDGSYDFFETWNSPAMVELRRRLKEGPLFSQCMRCPPEA
ncbi:MAG TPA: radical SAM protein, partial [Bacteroides sp.]|nr:radical SAM protein [Bacteroides sp.]